VFRIARLVVVFVTVLGTGAAVALLASSYGRPELPLQTDIALPSPTDRTVVAELFTSEGCSSCPPADELLRRLARDQFVPGIRVLALEEHVDYWDRLGWRDLFSSPAFSNRQSEYEARVFHTGSVYTPQLVIDGRLQEVGSDVNAVRRTIARAGHDAKAEVRVAAQPDHADHLRVQVQVSTPPGVVIGERADVIVALTEDQLTSDVARGENGGRRLTHSAVVRSLTALGSLTALKVFSGVTSIPTAPSWTRKNLAVVAFVQERHSRRIVGAGSTDVVDHHPNGSIP
jgi:hypothetical protein